MPLSQAVLNRHATLLVQAMRGLTESVTLRHKAQQESASTALVVPDALITEFSARELAVREINPEDRRCRIRTAALAVNPTRWSTITRSDSSLWQIASVQGGEHHPFWDLRLQRIG